MPAVLSLANWQPGWIMGKAESRKWESRNEIWQSFPLSVFSFLLSPLSMRCPKCGSTEDKVSDSREAKEGTSIRRRRECQTCWHRFTTYETVEHEDLMV